MNESNLILLDTNVILDVTHQDEHWLEWSQEQMSRNVGRLIINPIIYSELCYEAGSKDEVDGILAILGLGFEALSRKALYLAAQAFKVYRIRGGGKSSPLPDFFIGAHATSLGIPILTRDVIRYRSYFPNVDLISP